MPSPALMTADALLRDQPPNKDTELIRGRMIVREPPSGWHGMRAATLCALLLVYVRANKLGAVFAQDTGFQIERDPDTVLAPDVAFVATARMGLIAATGYPRMAPDLVAEILSPGDRRAAVERKVARWLRAGVRLVWVIDPRRREARVWQQSGLVTVVGPDGELTGDDVIPGFRCALTEILD